MSDRGEIIQRGLQAKELLDNEFFRDMLEDLRQNTFDRFLGSKSASDDERTKLWSIGQSLTLVEHQLEAYVDAARVEEANKKLDEDSKKMNRDMKYA